MGHNANSLTSRHSHRSLTLAAMMMFAFHKPVNWPTRWLSPAIRSFYHQSGIHVLPVFA